MPTDLINFFLNILAKLGPWNAKIEQVWPILKNMADEARQILTIVNGGKVVALAGSPTTPDGSRLLSELTSKGVDHNEAREAVITLEALHGRM